MMLVYLEGCWCEGERCWEEDRIALLQLKPFLNSTYYLQDWVEGDEKSDCCQWKRVECNSTTGKVIKLWLSYVRKVELGDQWYLNTSLFSPFQELQWLDLSWNGISGWVQSKGLQKLPRLEVLDLGGNFLNNSIFSSLSGLTSLKTLNLYRNRLNGTVIVQDLQKLSRLEVLDLSGNFLDNSILSSLAGLTSLKTLHLFHNRLNGTVIVQGVESLRNLAELDLSGNQIGKFVFPKALCYSHWGHSHPLKKLDLSYSNFRRGTMTAQELKNLTNVEDLILDYSSLHITILQSFGAFTSLKRLSMKNCKLSGILHNQGVPNFKNLKSLFMDGTALNISFFQIIKPMASLEILSLASCGLTGTLPNQGLCKLKQLKELYMNNNELRGTLPWCLANLTSLQGEFPNWLLENNTKLETLLLVNNSLSGPFQLPIHPHQHLTNLDISVNSFYGHIPMEIGPKLPRLISLNISRNAFNGSIPSSIGDMNSLESLDFSDSYFSGEIPEKLAMGCFSLRLLALSNNSLEDLGFNFFTGNLPNWIDRLSLLRYLILANNNLEGELPLQLCELDQLRIMDLSHNNFTGFILPCLNMSERYNKGYDAATLTSGFLDQVPAYSPLPAFAYSQIGPPSIEEETIDFTTKNRTYSYSGRILMYMSGIDLSSNKLIGEIPHQIGNLTMLHSLNFSHNNLTGPIPSEISNLKVN
ncbi:hypothetical protein Patl1_14756 [Pistacia atlantica]|uniref:Uncharacterized protein n=1 Tax=Pistacia atlantica TaxID=434234 RepID=A0ACC1ASI9_9ROSI|nr:hypothetical protein Patl1_14756 [Pistacia atlantica]